MEVLASPSWGSIKLSCTWNWVLCVVTDVRGPQTPGLQQHQGATHAPISRRWCQGAPAPASLIQSPNAEAPPLRITLQRPDTSSSEPSPGPVSSLRGGGGGQGLGSCVCPHSPVPDLAQSRLSEHIIWGDCIKDHTHQLVSLDPGLPLVAEGGLTSEPPRSWEGRSQPGWRVTKAGEGILTPLPNTKCTERRIPRRILENNSCYTTTTNTYKNIPPRRTPPGLGGWSVKAHEQSRSGKPCPWPAPTAPHGPGRSPGHLGRRKRWGERWSEQVGDSTALGCLLPHTPPPYPSHPGSDLQTSGCRCGPIR